MEEITKNISPKELVPVLLGYGAATREAAYRLFRKHAVISHVFSPPLPFPLRFSPFMKFHMVGKTSNEELMFRALCDFAEQLGNRDLILYLIPCTNGYLPMLKKYKSQLERYYIFADQHQCSLLFYNRKMLEGGDKVHE